MTFIHNSDFDLRRFGPVQRFLNGGFRPGILTGEIEKLLTYSRRISTLTKPFDAGHAHRTHNIAYDYASLRIQTVSSYCWAA